ncbi:hypothetical protein EFA46_007410 [Halarchaeum sp. CBA1220]|uniref:hypothetical protein n=1 Tax=Halarchaeum sp. CBA1220 TaxID=1853682 RepID=UPI000F3A822E|nr:hypothetical protein [Halarchaeum sp. CBA1220]QLC34036.1 hypothetical protein EFA46_007410 [Halarchaeum sp. CBA1220]
MTRSLPRRVAALALVVLIVSSTAAAPVAGATSSSTSAIDSPTVAPSVTSGTCSQLAITASWTAFGMTNGQWALNASDLENDCQAYLGSTSSEVENVRDAKTNQTKVDIALAAQAQRAQFETTKTVFNNHLNDSQSAAWMRAEVAVAKAWANNSSKTEARAAAREAIKDYWSAKQYNLLSSKRTQISVAWTLRQRAVNESDVSNDLIQTDPYGYPLIGIFNDTYQLPNGSTVTTLSPQYRNGGEQEASLYLHKRVVSGTEFDDSINKAFVVPSTSQTPQTVLYDNQWYRTQYDRINQLSEQQLNTSYDWIDGMWPALENGTVTPSEITSRTTDLYRTSPDSDGNVNLYDAVAALSGMGLAAPDMDGLGTMEVRHNTTTDYGLLLADEAPGGAWQSNTTYAVGGSNTSAVNVSAPVYLATTDGRHLSLKGEFKIGNITSMDGASVANVSATKTTYQTSNTTEYVAKMEALLNQSKAINARLAAGGSGSGSGSGSGDSGPLIIVGLAVVAIGAAAVMQRD